MTPTTLAHIEKLEPATIVEILDLVESATTADGVRPLSEHVMLHLAYGGDTGACNLLAHAGDELVGYAHLDPTDPVEGASAELVVHPGHRRSGLGEQLVSELLTMVPDGRLRLWSHGGLSGAAALARRLGFQQVRALWQMRRSLYAPLGQPDFPPGIEVRTFRVGRDEQAWTDVNNRAFAGHPDQGSWAVEEVRLREREPWFDPEGFFLAERAGALVGFHWTKVHGGNGSSGHPHGPIGEVYIVGVDPGEQTRGLGRALTLTGLHYLRSRGLAQVMLYVDEENSAAIALYSKLGFARWDTDVCYAHLPPG